MIDITDNKVWKLYVRTNRRVKWQYSEYSGRYETIEKAIESAKNRYNSTLVEYLIENMVTNEEVKGFLNCNQSVSN